MMMLTNGAKSGDTSRSTRIVWGSGVVIKIKMWC